MRFKSVLMFVAVCLVTTASFAQSASDIEALRERVRLLEARIAAMGQDVASGDLEEIRRQIEVLTREIEQMQLTRTVAEADESSWGLGAAASKVYRTGQGVSIGGYGEMIYESYDSTKDDGTVAGAKNTLDVLRAILYTGYKFNDRVLFNSELEVEHSVIGEGAGGEVALEFAYLDFLTNPAFNVRAGLVLMPVGIVNEQHEPTSFLGAERPFVERVIIPATWREPGVGAFGEFGQFAYRTYLVTGLDSADFSASNGIRGGRQSGSKALAEDLAWVGRLDWQPVPGTMLGGSIYAGGSGQGRVDPAGGTIEGTVMLTELHADSRFRGWWLRALWADGSIDDAAAINRANGLSGNASIGDEFSGWYAEAGYDVATLFDAGKHSIMPFVRYESFDTQASVPDGYAARPSNDVTLTTIGVAWKPIPQAVIKLDFQNWDRADDSGIDQINLGLGYIF